jgi:putative glutamine amidotransferase
VLALVLGAAAPAAADKAGPDITMARIDGLGPMMLFGKNPREAAQAFVDRIENKKIYPGSEKALRRWARRQKSKPVHFDRLANSNKPIIGVQLNRVEDILSGKGLSPRTKAVVQGIRRAGGIPMLLPPAYDGRRVRTIVKNVDHVFLLGGDDIHPKLYGQKVTHAEGLKLARDVYEQAMTKAALSMQKRIVGVCRGCQNIAIARGGSLNQDIHKDGITTKDHGGLRDGVPKVVYHPVKLEKGSGAAKTFGTTNMRSVNSLHHQSIKKPGRGMRVTGRAPDGIPEMIESKNDMARGYQFHPEMDAKQLKQVSKDVVEKAKKAKKDRSASIKSNLRRSKTRPSQSRKHQATRKSGKAPARKSPVRARRAAR